MVTFKRGEDLLKYYSQNCSNLQQPVVFVLDLTIRGGMGGKKTMEGIREISPDAKVILMSGYSNDDTIVNYKDYGFDGRILKPSSIEAINEEISKVLSKT